MAWLRRLALQMTRPKRVLPVMLAGAAVRVLIGLAIVSARTVSAQSPVDAPSLPTFEVASVKPHNAVELPTLGGMEPGGRLFVFNAPLRLLIRNAYQLQDRQLVGPTWINSERFDIEAKAPGDLPAPRPGRTVPSQLMMRSLLAERFKLVVHQETRELRSYSLERARRDGTLGQQLHRSRDDCAAIAAARQRSGGSPPQPQDIDGVYCGFQNQGTPATGGQMRAGGFLLSQLATVLSQMLQELVVDNTGLTGGFDWNLKWAAVPLKPTDNPPLPGSDADGPSIFTALQEQLGLRLRWGNAPVPVLVVDHVERPTPD